MEIEETKRFQEGYANQNKVEHPKRIVNSASQRQTQDLKEESQTCQQKEERQRIGQKWLEEGNRHK